MQLTAVMLPCSAQPAAECQSAQLSAFAASSASLAFKCMTGRTFSNMQGRRSHKPDWHTCSTPGLLARHSRLQCGMRAPQHHMPAQCPPLGRSTLHTLDTLPPPAQQNTYQRRLRMNDTEKIQKYAACEILASTKRREPVGHRCPPLHLCLCHDRLRPPAPCRHGHCMRA